MDRSDEFARIVTVFAPQPGAAPISAPQPHSTCMCMYMGVCVLHVPYASRVYTLCHIPNPLITYFNDSPHSMPSNPASSHPHDSCLPLASQYPPCSSPPLSE